MAATRQDSSSNWRLGRRGISGITAAIILIVVVVVVGGAGYAGLSAAGGSSSASPPATCAPLTSPVCSNSARINDVVLFVPYQPGYGQIAFQSTQGATLPASVYLTNGETASSFSVNWGDGTTTTQSTTSFTHNYPGLGQYVVSATADVGGVTHTGTAYLFPIVIGPSATSQSSGEFPAISATFNNGTASGVRPWVHVGGTVTVAASYTTLPSAAGYTALPPTITATSGATLVTNGSSADAATATYTFTTPGVNEITFVGQISAPHGYVWQNYTWSVFVGQTGASLACTYCTSGGSTGGSPHPGTIYSYEIAPGGATSLDPSVDYETVGGEVIMNTYEQLVNYNASSTSTFVPVLSTCVPGPAATGPNSCAAQYNGNDLNAAGSLGAGQYWTFPISSTAQFYDSSTGAHWGVYPSDVMFSVLRTMMWLQTPSQYVYNGWIIGQSLLPYGNSSFDNSTVFHAPWNNTPTWMLNSMLINDTAYCPASAMVNDHGCITFDADGSGSLWPFFLEFVQDMEGASVVPCGWYSAHGGGIPDFAGTSAANGDGPCWLPSGSGQTTTNSSTWTNYVNSVPSNAYDNLEAQGALNPYQPQPSVRWSVVASGPYYPVSVNLGQGYVLKANPYYAEPNCVAAPGCYPAPGHYASNVYVFWDPDSTAGLEQYVAGQADFASFFPTDTPTILNLVKQGKIGLLSVPTLETFDFGYNFWLNSTATEGASSITMNVPADFFDNPAMRAFLSNAFPYNYSLTQINTEDGITYDNNLGGAIPDGLGNYYPTNISWPGYNTATATWHDPSSDASVVGGAAYWWKQLTTVGSPYYDPEISADCSTTTPCTWPMVSEQGAPQIDTAVDAWNADIKSISGGLLAPSRWDPTFSTLVANSADPPGTSPFPVEIDGWLPDYPDPTDYMAPYYAANGSYTFGAGLGQVFLAGPAGPDGTVLSPGPYYCAEGAQLGTTYAQNFSALAFWANGGLVNETCQGTATLAMDWAMNFAATDANPTQRLLLYNMIESVGNNLVLYMYYIQPVGIGSYANWINPSTITTNSIQPGQQWYLESGLNVV